MRRRSHPSHRATPNFDFLKRAREADKLREVIARTITDLATVGAPTTWALSHHDETHHATRYGRTHTGITTPLRDQGHPTDLALGTRPIRAAVLMMPALEARHENACPVADHRLVVPRGHDSQPRDATP
ncbi:hypothetical protein QFZ24_008677 [Streptomyces phaeochromogenes]|uniref:hypothetical protein n=1 Tax=Streptomyces phaeochromogenes TaxID=1923 RepID=UPI0027936151|nr:hypothetical protein [Streptomyces phaeochromogenes]MDQ0954754.1 hypothetical protein [Streptomyces phaeochromogenes]